MTTDEVARMLAVTPTPVIVSTSSTTPTLPGTVFIDMPATGAFDDDWQRPLSRLMTELTGGNPARPVLVFGYNQNRWHARNLALRLIALGYTDVSWYRGGWEAWEANGLRREPLSARRRI